MGCNSETKKHTDDFYRRKGGFDYYRLPLLKPYELISTADHPDYWSTTLKEREIAYEIIIAGQQLYVAKDFFIIACFQQCVVKGVAYPTVYYLVVPNKKKGAAFNSLNRLTQYVFSEFGEKNITFRNIKDVYGEFVQTDTVPWKNFK